MAIGDQLGGIRSAKPAGIKNRFSVRPRCMTLNSSISLRRYSERPGVEEVPSNVVETTTPQIGVNEQSALSLLAGDNLRQIRSYEGLTLVR